MVKRCAESLTEPVAAAGAQWVGFRETSCRRMIFKLILFHLIVFFRPNNRSKPAWRSICIFSKVFLYTLQLLPRVLLNFFELLIFVFFCFFSSLFVFPNDFSVRLRLEAGAAFARFCLFLELEEVKNRVAKAGELSS